MQNLVLSVHAAVIAINDAINHQVASVTLEALRNPNAHLVEINANNSEEYQQLLYNAKSSKSEIAFSKVSNTKAKAKAKSFTSLVAHGAGAFLQFL